MDNNNQSNNPLPVNDEEATTSRHIKHRGKRFGILLTAVVLAAVLGLNILVSALSSVNLWYVDMTKEKYRVSVYEYNEDGTRKHDKDGKLIVSYTETGRTMYTLTDDFRNLIENNVIPKIDEVNTARRTNGDDAIKVNIVFCNEPDLIDKVTSTRYIHYTALNLVKYYPDYFEITYINTVKNPSAVQKYKETSTSTIYPSNMILEFGTEYRVYSTNAMYTINDGDNQPWAYNGEKKFAAGIMGVTRAESPICCITTNHGESLPEDSSFVKLITAAGYDVRFINLYTEDIPDDCRLVITYGPKTDFIAYGSPEHDSTGISEITKLDKYLDRGYSFMFFFNPGTPELENLEVYLEEWGISVSRTDADKAGSSDNLTVVDPDRCLDGAGYTIVSQYVTEGFGGSFTSDMRNVTYPSKVIFDNSGVIVPSDSYVNTYVVADETNNVNAYNYYTYSRNGISRAMYSMFTSGITAHAEADGTAAGNATETNPYRLMTITRESRSIQEDNYNTVNDSSYVCAVASTDFVSDAVLDSASYGNTDVMLSVLHGLSGEIVPVNLQFKPFYIYDMADETYDGDSASVVTTCLALIPAFILFTAGIVVNVRRKYL